MWHVQAAALRADQLGHMMAAYTLQQEAVALTVIAWQARFGSLLAPQRCVQLATTY